MGAEFYVMPGTANAPSAAVLSVLELISAKLDAIEAELKRLGWWSAEPPDLQGEVAAGRLKSWLDAPCFEIWLQCIFLPNARARVAEADMPAGSSVGEMARREYDYHSQVPEAMPLMGLLREFDYLIVAYNNMKEATATAEVRGLAEEVREPGAGRPRPKAVEGMAVDFENALLAKREEMAETLAEVERELPQPAEGGGSAGAAESVERWLATGFLPEVREWLKRGQVPQESHVGEAAEKEWAQRGVLGERGALLGRLREFDARVGEYHALSGRLETESAAGRLAAAWRCIMAEPETVQNPQGATPDAVRRQMLLTLNRVEAELKLTGWWAEVPAAMPVECTRALEYWAGNVDRSLLPVYPLWLQSVFLPGMRARVQAGDFSEVRRMRDDANRALCEERLGPAKFAETRRLYNAMGEVETLLERSWPAARRQHEDASRRRGLSGPRSAAAEKAAAESVRFREDVREAAERALRALEAPLWQGGESEGAGSPLPFENWLRDSWLPEVMARLKDGRLLEERRVSDYAAWECRLSGLTEAAEALLAALEKVDHWSAHANRAAREQWEG
jgi:uncharacterized protein YqcC (DUF446 family)